MTGDLPRLDRVETLGDDSPTLVERVGGLARRHPLLTAAISLAAALTAVGVVGLWWVARPVPLTPTPFDAVRVSIASTGMGGVVTGRTLIAEGGAVDTATVVLEMKASLAGSTGVTGRIRGIIGSGIQSSSAGNIPSVQSGDSVVGIVTSTISCGTALADESSYRLVVDLSDGSLTSLAEAPLDGVQDEWISLLNRACLVL